MEVDSATPVMTEEDVHTAELVLLMLERYYLSRNDNKWWVVRDAINLLGAERGGVLQTWSSTEQRFAPRPQGT
jgi:hypothetical protein